MSILHIVNFLFLTLLLGSHFSDSDGAICVFTCKSSDDCPENMVCCRNGCGASECFQECPNGKEFTLDDWRRLFDSRVILADDANEKNTTDEITTEMTSTINLTSESSTTQECLNECETKMECGVGRNCCPSPCGGTQCLTNC